MSLLSLLEITAATSLPLCIITTNFCIIVFSTRSFSGSAWDVVNVVFPCSRSSVMEKLLDDQERHAAARWRHNRLRRRWRGKWPQTGEQTLRGVKYEQKQTRQGAKSTDICRAAAGLKLSSCLLNNLTAYISTFVALWEINILKLINMSGKENLQMLLLEQMEELEALTLVADCWKQ